MTHNLLPCPFCGDEPTLRKSGARNNSQYMAMCARGCGACNGWKDTPEAANAAWNRREPIGNSNELSIRSEVKKFAEFMEVSLQLNDYKGGWRNETPEWLMSRLKDEVQELQAALDFALYNEEKIGECVDVANYAMMIADVLSLRREDAE